MSKAQNRHDTVKWKRRRKDHFGDLCNKADCVYCAAHKTQGNAKKAKKAKDLRKLEAIKCEENDLN